MQPFVVAVDRQELDDLHDRLRRARWPQPLPGEEDWRLGAPVASLQTLARRWLEDFDWRATETELNAHPQVLTTIDGTTVHAIHARSSSPDATPLLLLHGWPGSVVEFLDVIGPLTEPGHHGAGDGPAFHVIAPSLPGYGFSGPTPDAGWTVERMADAVAELVRELGYERFGVQGGDWGSNIALAVTDRHADRVIGVHVNMLSPDPEAPEHSAKTQAVNDRYEQDLSAYNAVQSQRPGSLTFAMSDSPIGLLAWIAERFHDWTDPATPVDADRILADVSVYWFTRTYGSSAALYRETARHGITPRCLEVPVGVALAPHDIEREDREIAEQRLKIVRWTEFDRGGHFAALEIPELLVPDIREFFGALR